MGQNDNNWYSFTSPSWENNVVFPNGEQDEDIEDVAKKLNKAIRDHIELEAQDLHFLPKNGVLPL